MKRVFVMRVMQWLVAGLLVLLGSLQMAAQTKDQSFKDDAPTDRKVVTRVEPDYPETLKRLYIGGTVRVQVVVEPGGEVTKTELLGGSPILGQSAMKAIKQWKYAKAPAAETLVVKMDFDPHF